MDLNIISPYVRYAARSYLSAPFTLGQRCIFDYEIIYVEFGKFKLSINKNDYICKKDDVILIRPGQSHTLQSIDNIAISQPHIHFDMVYDENSESIYISFKDYPQFTISERALIRKDFFRDMDIGPILRISDPEQFKSCLFDIITTFYEKPNLYQLTCKQKMIQLLQMVIHDNMVAYDPSPQVEDVHMIIKEFIDYNFMNPITLESLEKQFHYSRFYISKIFSQHFNTSVIKYYNNKRLEYAKAMLKRGSSVSKVSQDLHFNSIYTFSRYFKNSTGLSPSIYKKMVSTLKN